MRLLARSARRGLWSCRQWTDNDDAVFDRLCREPMPTSGSRPTFSASPGVKRGDHPFAFAALGRMPRRSRPILFPCRRIASKVPSAACSSLGGRSCSLASGTIRTRRSIWQRRCRRAVWCAETHYRPRGRTALAHRLFRERSLLPPVHARRPVASRAGSPARRYRRQITRARLIRSRNVVETVGERLRADPLVFLHPRGSGCFGCDNAHASIRK